MLMRFPAGAMASHTYFSISSNRPNIVVSMRPMNSLILCCTSTAVQVRDAPPNSEAHAFASSFLMPRDDVLSTIPFVTTLKQIVRAKGRRGVSVAALAHRLHKLRVLTGWQYRTFCIQINRTFGSNEPDGLAPERSSVWQMVLTDLWKDGIARHHIASDLHPR